MTGTKAGAFTAFGHRAAVVEGIVVVAANLTLLTPPIGVDDAVVAVAAADHHEDPLALAVFDELHAVGLLELDRKSVV